MADFSLGSDPLCAAAIFAAFGRSAAQGIKTRIAAVIDLFLL
jgi:hypothetical protein